MASYLKINTEVLARNMVYRTTTERFMDSIQTTKIHYSTIHTIAWELYPKQAECQAAG